MSEVKSVEQTIRQYIAQVVHMSLATCVDNSPWVCEVHFAYDDNLNLYFRSLPSRRHSQEIAQNPKVAGNIITQHFLEQPGVRGVYFEGTAKLLKPGDEQNQAYETLSKRLNAGPEFLEEAKNPDGHQFYKITVDTFYLFDTYKSKPAQKYELKWTDRRQ